MRYLGIDPGVSGAVAVYSVERKTGKRIVAVRDMPSFHIGGRSKIEPPLLADIIREMIEGDAAQIWIENVSAVPVLRRVQPTDANDEPNTAVGLTTSSVANFALGRARGICEGIAGALGVPLHAVSPRVWKKVVGVNAAARGIEQKRAARARAIALFPELAELFKREKDHNRAEAVLIALAGSRLDPDRPMYLP